MTATLRIPMVSLEEAKDVPGALVRLPYIDIDLVAKQMAEMSVFPQSTLGLVPPYTTTPGFAARSSIVVRDRFPEHRIYVPMAGGTIKEVLDFMSTMRSDGFENFVFPADWRGMSGMSFDRIAPFLRHEIRKDGHYHLAGAKPEVWRLGHWTWSEEEL